MPQVWVERLKTLIWSDVMLAVSFTSCLLTPIEIGVIQDIHFYGALFVVLLLCDAVAVLDVYYELEQNVWAPFVLDRFKERGRVERLHAKSLDSGARGSGGSAASDKLDSGGGTLLPLLRFLATNSVPDKGVILLRAVSASPFFVLPIAGLCGLQGEHYR